MKISKLLVLCVLLPLIHACSHPIEIRGEGEGDVTSLSGTRNCSLEEYQGELPNCTDNIVVTAYEETYTALPRAGAQFRRWGNYCTKAQTNTCSFDVPEATVVQSWFTTVPPLQAIFRPTVNTGFDSLFIGNNLFGPLAAGIESHALAAGFPDHTTTQFIENGDAGAPLALWNDLAKRNQIKAVLNSGTIDLLGMTYSPAYPTVLGYQKWVRSALKQNPDTRFFIAAPWGNNPSGTNNTQFEADLIATRTQILSLIDALRTSFPGVDFYYVPSGESAVELFNLYSNNNLPDVTGLIGTAADSLFADNTGNPGDILAELGQLVWLGAIYGVDLSSYAYVPSWQADLITLAETIINAQDSQYHAPPEFYPDTDGDGIPDYLDPFELLDLVPAATRGVFQVYPGATGAMVASVDTTPWGFGPLQILERYSAGMDLTGNAERLVLAQLAGAADEFVLMAVLDAIDVATLTANTALTGMGTFQGHPRWSIDGTDLQLASLDTRTLVIAPSAALEETLNVSANVANNIHLGPLAGYLAGLTAGQPNSFIYGLPALYGAVPAPGSGAFSLSQAQVVSASFGITNDVLSGGLSFYTNNAVTFRTKMLQQLAGYPAPPIVAAGSLTSVLLAGLSADDDIRPLLKTLFIDMDAVDYADVIVHGGNAPWLNFQVGENPNSIFINFEFSGQTERDNFTAQHLPAGFTLSPIRILDTDIPRYFLVLNIYQSSGGLVQDARAEWSVFVNDPDTNAPRFLVVQAAAAAISADSVNLLTQPEPVTHELTLSAVESYVGVVDPQTEIETLYFSSTIDWPQAPETRVNFHREFVASNDYIFWGNGVADRGLYNSSVHNRQGVLVDPNQFSFTDNTGWASFIDPAPVHALVYLNPLDIVISPWWNLDELYLDITEAYRTTLINFKNAFYPGLIKGNAQAGIRGTGLALSTSTINDSTPTASYHFPLTNAQGLLDQVSLPGTYTPAAVALFDGEVADYYLTLSVYHRENDPCGTRAEWITYVAGTDGRPDSLRLDTLSTEACLDPVSLITAATDLSQGISAGWLNTSIDTPFIRFEADLDLALTSSELVGQSWLEAGDEVCSLNGVCDEFYYDGQLLLAPAMHADTFDVQIVDIATPWDAFINPANVRATVRDNVAIQALNPWRTLRSYAANAPAP